MKDEQPSIGERGFPMCDATMRDWFAAEAMAALISKIPLHEREGRDGGIKASDEVLDSIAEGVALSAYEYADAMLTARSKQNTQQMGEKKNEIVQETATGRTC